VSTTEQIAQALEAEVEKAVVGQSEVVRQCILAVLAGGHVLLEGVPGTAKTLLVKTLARAIGCDFRRIQLTPDLMPADILGVNVFNTARGEFEFRQGPIFTQFLLADEINRAPAKTQSALLEGMEERRVTVDGEPHRLPEPFTVFATQNPVEHEGTYPLPEAQLDRFLFKTLVDYPPREHEGRVLDMHHRGLDPHDVDSLGVQAVASPEQISSCQAEITAVNVEEPVMGYVLDLVRATRQSPFVLLGASPRAAALLLVASKAAAAGAGREFLVPDDVKDMASPTLRHRLILQPEAEVDGLTPDAAIESIVASVPVPR
jgi:MoxR-like ATPase